MRAPAEIPHADEALRSLFQRFKEAPGSPAFGDLAEALLARGHAAEALRVAEHGLQLTPDSSDGRVHRAAALLALARPRVAYVELLRALAIDTKHQKALRLLGRVFVEAGAPERAAALLRRRHEAAVLPPRPSSSVESIGVATPPPLPRPKSKSKPGPKVPPALDLDTLPHDARDIPELFASLTHDLGLGPVPNDFAANRVEVTQVIRARLRPRKDDPGDLLSSIDGPIVDTTQPGRIEQSPDRAATTSGKLVRRKRPSSVYDVVTSPEFHITHHDEQLFSEKMPFEVRPVGGPPEETETIDDQVTVNDNLPDELDLELLRRAIEDGQPVTESGPAPRPPVEVQEPETTLPEDQRGGLMPAPDLPYLRRFKRGTSTVVAQGPPLEVRSPPVSASRLILGGLAAMLVFAFAAGLLLWKRDLLMTWVDTSALVQPEVERSAEP